MTDETYRARKRVDPDDVAPVSENPLDNIASVQEALRSDSNADAPQPPPNRPEMPFQVSGKIPEAFKKALGQGASPTEKRMPQPKVKSKPSKDAGSEQLEEMLRKIHERHVPWEEVNLPSDGKFYDDIPGTLHIRPMTGEEEQILATTRYSRKGRTIDMIFERCIRESIDTEKLLSVDRTYLLIYLRGISYTPEYDVEIKCPVCATRFNSVIDLDQDLTVDGCPEDFDASSLIGVLPTTGFQFQYRLATGADEQAVTRYRDMRVKEFGDQSDDDTLLYRTSLLVERIEGVTDPREINVLLKALPINDVVHLRNTANDVPFGVVTEIDQVCPSCSEAFDIELPMETSFFFPRKKVNQTHA